MDLVFWGARAAFSLDACCVLSQRELAVIPSIRHVQALEPVHTPRARAGWGLWSVPAWGAFSGSGSLGMLLGWWGLWLGRAMFSQRRLPAPASGAHEGSGGSRPLLWSAIAWEHARGEESFYDSTTSLLLCPLTLPLCLSGVPLVLSHTPSVATLQPLQAISAEPTLVLSPGLTPKSWASASSPHLYWQTSDSAWRVPGGSPNQLLRSLSDFPSSDWLLCLLCLLSESPSRKRHLHDNATR